MTFSARARRRDAGLTRVVLVTGASSGIGHCTALLFARKGWRVGLVARGSAGLDAVRASISAMGGMACTAVADVRDPLALEAAALRVEDALGPVDAWVNCAGNGVYGRFLDVTDEEFRCVTDVTYLGAVHGTRIALRRMVPRGAGCVVNVCSAIAFHGLPLLTSYSGAKSALRGFTEAVQGELRAERSRVALSLIYPPAVNTPFFSHAASHLALPPRPARPVYQPELVAEGILLAVATGRAQVQVGAVTVLFGWITRRLPRLASWLIGRLGYEGQVSRDPAVAARRDPTLFAPSSRVAGRHGPFGRESFTRSEHLWLRQHPATLALGAGLLAAAAAFGWTRRRRSALSSQPRGRPPHPGA